MAEADTAAELRSGDVPMLGTPRVVALVEEATVAALAGPLEPQFTSVGMRVQLDHLVHRSGRHHRAGRATLERSRAGVSRSPSRSNNERGLVAAGKLARVLVHRQRFLEKAQ